MNRIPTRIALNQFADQFHGIGHRFPHNALRLDSGYSPPRYCPPALGGTRRFDSQGRERGFHRPANPAHQPLPEIAYRTAAGRLFIGRTEDVLASSALDAWRGRVQMVFTSPPFPLVRKKKYGNLSGDAFAKWLASFATGLTQFLTPDGSIVIELGNGWNPGSPTVSTTGIKALLAFQEAAGLHLCQEFICFNPARLPTPAEWVTVRRDARQGRLHAGLVAVAHADAQGRQSSRAHRVQRVDAEVARSAGLIAAAGGRANITSATSRS